MIHGLPTEYAKMGKDHTQFDWTEGCIAVTNAEIDEIWRAIPMGAVIQIKP
jgi:L,D-peptidoglycan transpeptidase YkuD (ErfK/YbiS/YcfS/YnhG family)